MKRQETVEAVATRNVPLELAARSVKIALHPTALTRSCAKHHLLQCIAATMLKMMIWEKQIKIVADRDVLPTVLPVQWAKNVWKAVTVPVVCVLLHGPVLP
jgi:hypothetical protein